MTTAITRTDDSTQAGEYHRAWRADDAVASYVFLHGLGNRPGVCERFAQSLGERRINLWALDESALTGGPEGSTPSLDEVVELGMALATIAEASAPGLPLFVAGHSLGGVTAALAIARSPERFAGAVLSGTPLSPLSWVLELAVDGDGERSLADAMMPAWAELHATLGEVDRPILLVQGEADPIAPVEDARGWVARLCRGRLVAFRGARHDVLDEVVHGPVSSTIAAFVHEVARPVTA